MEKLKKNITLGDIILKNFLNLNAGEKEIVRNWRNDDAVREWSYYEHIISIKEHHNFIVKLAEDNRNIYWLVSRKNEYLGVISINRIDFENKSAYLGIYSNPRLKGVGSLLMKCLKEVVFDIANLHTLKLEVMEDNKKAIKFYKESGFEKEGKLIDYVIKNNLKIRIRI